MILGFATTKFLETALNSKKEIRHVVIIEPNVSRFHQTIKRHYLAPFLEDERIDFLIGIPQAELRSALFKIFSNYNHKMGARPSTCLQPEVVNDAFVYGEGGVGDIEEAKELFRLVNDTTKLIFLSMGCAADSFNRWEQMMRNEGNLKSCYNISPLYEKFSLLPAIVLGAGPSLPEFIEACKKYDLTNKAVVIACDASLKRLLAEGIKPHFVTRCERKLTQIFEGVEKKDTSDIFYAAYPWCPPEFFDLFQESFMIFRNNGVCKWTTLPHGEVNGGVSSGNAGLELAFNLGCQKIYLAGIDLCFMGEKSHCEGTEVEFDINKSKPQWTKIMGNSGEKVTTIPVWHRCKQEYENQIIKYREKNKEVKIYNTSQNGVKLDGAPLKEWENLEKKFQKNFRVLDIIRNNLAKPSEEDCKKYDAKKEETTKFLAGVKKSLDALFLFLDDSMINSMREEQKVLFQLKSHYNPTLFFHDVDSLKTGLVRVYENSCRQIENFKTEYYPKELFSATVLDTCQLDLFTSENKCNSLKNHIANELERMKAYIGHHHNLYCIFYYYTVQLLGLIKGELVRPELPVPLTAEVIE